MANPPVPRLAATVMVLRSGTQGPEVYLMRRAARSRFMPDAFVFPGGAVDPSDRAAAERLRASDPGASSRIEMTTLRIAAIRETFEESGLLLARDAASASLGYSTDRLAALRREVAVGVPFDELLARQALRPDLDALIHYSNWITPAGEPIRFDAHFFVAAAPDGQLATADAVEVHDGRWLRPSDALSSSERGELSIRFPTRKHLERLARFGDLDALFDHARGRAVAPIQPVARDDGSFAFDEDGW